MRISYRMATSEDVSAMAQFWSENSGWDIIDSAEWDRRFTNTPFGDAAVALAIDPATNKLIGQFVFIPVTIIVNGKEVKAYRPYAPILQESLQTKFGITSWVTGQHPIMKMYNKVADDLAKNGTTLIYIIPDPRWARVLQVLPYMMTHKFPLWNHSLPLAERFELPNGITVEKIKPYDPEIDILWQKASHVYSSAIVRDSKTLAWKTSHGDFKGYAIYMDTEMIGFFATVYKAKDHQWLICDLLTKDNDKSLPITLKAACNVIQEENALLPVADDHSRKIAILGTPAIEEVVRKIDFVKNAYHFTLAVHLLNKNNVDKKDITPVNWYVSAND